MVTCIVVKFDYPDGGKVRITYKDGKAVSHDYYQGSVEDAVVWYLSKKDPKDVYGIVSDPLGTATIYIRQTGAL